MLRRRIALHVSILLIGATVLRLGVVPAEVCPPTDATAVTAAAHGAIEWLVSGQGAAGTYRYGFDRDTDSISTDYNDARHAGVTMSLYQAYEQMGDRAALVAADRGRDVALTQLYEGPGWVAWRPTGDVPVGANGLLLAGMAVRRSVSGDPAHDDVMRGIGRFLVSQQQADGSIYASYDVSREEARVGYGPFATGEAAWALALLDHEFPGEGWGEAAARTLDYMARDRNATEGYLTSLPDHWAAYALSDLRAELLTPDRLEYARRLAGYFGVRLRFEAQRRGTGINLLLRWYPGPPAGVGTAGEGLGALRDLAGRDSRLDDLVGAMDERLRCMAGFMAQRQVIDPAAPIEERGAWFYRGYTQMDDQQHVLSALLAARRVMQEDER